MREHLDRLPQVITHNRNHFYEFIKNIVKYVNNSTIEIEKINANANQQINYIESIPYLQRLQELMNVRLKYASTTKNGFDKNVFINALNGAALARNADGSKQSIIDLLNALFPGSRSATITDNGVADLLGNSTVMSYEANIQNPVTTVDEAFLINYLKPEILGVREMFSFLSTGYFASMITTQIEQNEKIYLSELKPADDVNGLYDNFNGALQWCDIGFGSGNTVYETPVFDKTQQSSSQVYYTGIWLLEII